MNNKDIGRYLAELNNLIHREISKNEFNNSSDPEISRASSGILIYLSNAKDRPVYQRDLEEEFQVRRSTISKVLSVLQTKGYIVRVAVNSDKRLKKIELTDKALKRIETLDKERIALEQKMTRGLSEKEMVFLKTTLNKIKQNLKEEEQN